MHQPADIRNLSARRDDGANVVELRSVDGLQDVIAPLKRHFGPPKVVTREHTSNTVRWKQGERLNHVIEDACARFADNVAVITDAGALTYRELDRRANQVARYLIEQGIKPGDRVGLLFDKSADTYVAMLAVMKVECRLCAARRRIPQRAHPLHPRRRRDQGDRLDVGLRRNASPISRCRRSFIDSAPSRRSTPSPPTPLTGVAPTVRSALLHHLHLGHDRQAEGRRHRAPEHLQLRPRRRRALRLSRRATASTRA